MIHATKSVAPPPAMRTSREYVNAGLIDEFSIALSPVLFGSGIRLFATTLALRRPR